MKGKSWLLYGALVGIALSGPLVAFAGVSIIYPKSTTTFDVNSSPPVKFDDDIDYASAFSSGLVTAFTGNHGNASYSLTMHGISGGNVTIDKLVNISKQPGVASYKVSIDTALSGTLTNPDSLRIRLWDHNVSQTAPTGDQSANVCAVLDLEATAGTESTGSCTGNAIHMQVTFDLPDGTVASGTATVSIRPSSVVFS